MMIDNCCNYGGHPPDQLHHGCNIRRYEEQFQFSTKNYSTRIVLTKCRRQKTMRKMIKPSSGEPRSLNENEKSYSPLDKRVKRHINSNNRHQLSRNNASRSIILLIFFFFKLFSILILLSPAFVLASTSLFSNYTVSTAQNRNPGHLSMSQLCATRSHFPITKRIEGTVLSSNYLDTDLNCTVLLRTKSAQQHFVIRFEELKLGCDDHLILFENDFDYGQSSIADLSCSDNMANVPIFKTTGTFLTLRYTTDRNSKLDDGFRAIVTAVFDQSISADCPPEYSFCRNHLCISRSLFCDGVNHCVDGSDEIICEDSGGRNDLSYALALLIVLVLVISICVTVFIATIHCRRESPYANQYQHHIQRAFGVPLQTSSSLMFPANQPQYQFFHQPANLSPFVTPQHHQMALATLPRGYSTLPLNLVRPINNPQRIQQPQHQVKVNSNHINEQMSNNNHDYLMMTTYTSPQQAQVTTGTNQTVQSNLILPSSQSILQHATNAMRYQAQPFNHEPR